MKRSILGIAALSAPVALGLMVAYGAMNPAASADEQPTVQYPMGPGGGFGMGPGGGYGMGPGMGRGARTSGGWPGAYMVDANHDGTLTVDEVKEFIDARHAQRGFEQFKVGEVTEQDDTISAHILDADGKEVRVLTFPRKVEAVATGRGPGSGMWGNSGRGFGRHGGGHGMGYGMHRGYGPGAAECAYGYGRSDDRGMRGRASGGGRGKRGDFGDRGFSRGMTYGLQADGVVTVDEVKGLVEYRLEKWRNPNLKVGEVKEKDEYTISADIVTKDGSLVDTLEFDRKTGRSLRSR